MRLQSYLKNDAFWIPPRLWCYAASHQQDGDFTKYTKEEISLAIGYNGDSDVLMEALEDAGFMNGMKLTDWEQHNSFHTMCKERASKAAKARWEKRDREENTSKRKDSKGRSNAQALLEACFEHIDVKLKDTLDIWIEYRKEIKKPVTPRSLKMVIKKCNEMGVSRAIKAIEHSIENGWQGIFEPNNNNTNKGKSDHNSGGTGELVL